jgi:hypothetical protein
VVPWFCSRSAKGMDCPSRVHELVREVRSSSCVRHVLEHKAFNRLRCLVLVARGLTDGLCPSDGRSVQVGWSVSADRTVCIGWCASRVSISKY